MFFFFQAEDGIRDLVRSRGLGDVYKRQLLEDGNTDDTDCGHGFKRIFYLEFRRDCSVFACSCLLYTSDAADERSSVDLGGRRIIKKKKQRDIVGDVLISR